MSRKHSKNSLQTIENLQTDFAELGLNLEVIVVDDDSRDGSRKLLRKAFLGGRLSSRSSKPYPTWGFTEVHIEA